MNLIEAKVILNHYLDEDIPTFLWGSPGIGKSDCVADLALEKGLPMIDIRAILLDPVDLRGLPHVLEGLALWAQPGFLPRSSRDGEKGILFLDELNAAPPSVQAACFVGDTIIAGKAYKPISELQIGDLVLDRDGHLRRVTEVFTRPYDGRLINIKGRNMLPLSATEEHPFLVIDTYQKGNDDHNKLRRVSEPRWARAADLRAGQYVGIPILRPSRKDSEVVIEECGSLKTSLSLTPDLARFLGYYVADGYSTTGRIGISLNVTEHEYHDDVANLIRGIFGRNPVIKTSSENVLDYGFGFAALGSFLKDACGIDTYHKKIPDFILFHEDLEIVRNFLIGYFRGDGHCYNENHADQTKKPFIGFTTVSKVLAMQVQQAFTRFDLLVSIVSRPACDITIRGKLHRQREHYRIQSSQNAAFDILDIIKARPTKRTTEHFFEERGVLWTKIAAIETSQFSGTVYNCEVEESHTYLAHNYIVHNCFQLVLNRKVGDYSLPKGWMIVAAGNKQSDRSAAQRMPSALANRFAHIEIDADMKSWQEWANVHGISPMVRAFLQFRENLLHKMDGGDLRAFPTPRAWAQVSKICDKGDAVRQRLVTGLVGEGAGAEFEGFIQMWKTLPPMAEIIRNPTGASIPHEPATRYAVSTGLSRLADRNNFANILIYAARLPKEFEISIATEAVKREKTLTQTTAYVNWAKRNQDVTL